MKLEISRLGEGLLTRSDLWTSGILNGFSGLTALLYLGSANRIITKIFLTVLVSVDECSKFLAEFNADSVIKSHNHSKYLIHI